jgi:hypothetical protein
MFETAKKGWDHSTNRSSELEQKPSGRSIFTPHSALSWPKKSVAMRTLMSMPACPDFRA